MLQLGDIWCWTINSADHPLDPSYNFFLVINSLDRYDAVEVLYLRDGRRVLYSPETFVVNKKRLLKVA
jgi:hypothetical protein